MVYFDFTSSHFFRVTNLGAVLPAGSSPGQSLRPELWLVVLQTNHIWINLEIIPRNNFLSNTGRAGRPHPSLCWICGLRSYQGSSGTTHCTAERSLNTRRVFFTRLQFFFLCPESPETLITKTSELWPHVHPAFGEQLTKWATDEVSRPQLFMEVEAPWRLSEPLDVSSHVTSCSKSQQRTRICHVILSSLP